MGDTVSKSLDFTGSLVSAIGSIVAGKKQKKAASAASAAMDKASKTSVITATNTAAPQTATTAQQSETAVAKAARKRYSLSDTVNNFTPAGLRKTLG